MSAGADVRGGRTGADGTGAAASGGVVAGAARWMALAQVSVQVTRLGVYVLLARLLEPAAFGLVAMATVVVTFLEVFRGLGSSEAIVQRQDLSARMISSVFWANVAFGGLVMALLAGAAPLVADVYGDDRLTPVLQVLSLSLLIVAFGETQQGLLRRELRFRGVALANIAQAVATALVSLALALAGLGVWALVLGTLAGSLALSGVSWQQSDWRPAFTFAWADLKAVAGFSVSFSASQVLNFFLVNGDKFLVGTFLGATSLGFYALAQRILMYPMSTVSGVVQEVLFPALSRLQHDLAAARATFLRAAGVVALVCFPISVGVAVVAHDLVLVVLGERWLPLVPLIRVLGPVGGLQAIVMMSGVLFMAAGRSDLLLRWGGGTSAFVVAGYLVGLPWGLIGVSASYAVTMSLAAVPNLRASFRLSGLPLDRFARSLAPYLAVTLAMASAAAAVQAAAHAAGLAPAASLALSVSSGALVYLGLAWSLRLPAATDVVRGVRARLLTPRPEAAGPTGAVLEGSKDV